MCSCWWHQAALLLIRLSPLHLQLHAWHFPWMSHCHLKLYMSSDWTDLSPVTVLVSWHNQLTVEPWLCLIFLVLLGKNLALSPQFKISASCFAIFCFDRCNMVFSSLCHISLFLPVSRLSVVIVPFFSCSSGHVITSNPCPGFSLQFFICFCTAAVAIQCSNFPAGLSWYSNAWWIKYIHGTSFVWVTVGLFWGLKSPHNDDVFNSTFV